MLFFRKLTAVSVIAVAGFAFSSACSSDEDGAAGTGANGTGADGSGNNSTGANGGTVNIGNGGDSATGDGGTNSTGDGGAAAGPTLDPDGNAFCGDVACQCSDGIDNDGDGDEDGFDVECQGPLDNDEGSFATGIPGDNRDESWVDCFFDGDSGAGNDGCKYPYECLTGELDINSDECALATSQECIDYCGPRTPNGCDCFGCCTIQLEDGPVDIFTLSGCSLDEIDNPDVCPRCEQQTDCQNSCGECELCPGKTVDDLPESCQPDPPAGGAPGDPPPVYTCEGGAQICSDTLPCDSGYYCSFGCCIPVIK